MDRRTYREVIGERLKEFREDRGMTVGHISKIGNIPVEKVWDIESGNVNYTMDDFISYIIGSGLYMYFSEKSENREKPHDFEDIAKKGIDADPHE